MLAHIDLIFVVEEQEDVVVALGSAGAFDVGVGEFVDERDLGLTRQYRVEVHLLEHRAPVLATDTRHNLEVA